jgi:hypothetical protein
MTHLRAAKTPQTAPTAPVARDFDSGARAPAPLASDPEARPRRAAARDPGAAADRGAMGRVKSAHAELERHDRLISAARGRHGDTQRRAVAVAERLPGLRAREGDLWAQGMQDAAAEIRQQRAQVEGELSDWALRIGATQAGAPGVHRGPRRRLAARGDAGPRGRNPAVARRGGGNFLRLRRVPAGLAARELVRRAGPPSRRRSGPAATRRGRRPGRESGHRGAGGGGGFCSGICGEGGREASVPVAA